MINIFVIKLKLKRLTYKEGQELEYEKKTKVIMIIKDYVNLEATPFSWLCRAFRGASFYMVFNNYLG